MESFQENGELKLGLFFKHAKLWKITYEKPMKSEGDNGWFEISSHDNTDFKFTSKFHTDDCEFWDSLDLYAKQITLDYSKGLQHTQ